MPKPKILIADDHPLLLKGLEDFIIEQKKYEIIASCDNGRSAYNTIIKESPDLAILDIEMPLMTGVDVAKECQKNNIQTKIILITLYKERKFFDLARSYGVYGYLLKEFALAELNTCIDQVLRGNPYLSQNIEKHFSISSESDNGLNELTRSEYKILKLIADDLTSLQIAETLSISARTVEKHRANIIRKLGLEAKTNALLIWAQKNKQLLH